MTPAQLLASMRDIHAPDEAQVAGAGGFSWWPLLLAALLVGSLFAWRWRRRRQWIRDTEGELRRIQALAQAGENTLAVQRLSILLRRLALLENKPALAGSTGEHWLQHLDTRFATTEFSRGVGRQLLDAPYQREALISGQALMTLVDTIRRGLKQPDSA